MAIRAGMAQLVEHFTRNEGVVGSSPISSLKEESPFVPFLGKNGYMADVTRHGKDAPGGVMETVPSTGSSENFKPFQYPNIKKSCCFTNLICKTTAFLFLFIYLLSIYGHRGDRIRTCDLLIPNQAL